MTGIDDLKVNWEKWNSIEQREEMCTQAWLEILDLLSILSAKELTSIERAKVRRAENFAVSLEFTIDKMKGEPTP